MFKQFNPDECFDLWILATGEALAAEERLHGWLKLRSVHLGSEKRDQIDLRKANSSKCPKFLQTQLLLKALPRQTGCFR